MRPDYSSTARTCMSRTSLIGARRYGPRPNPTFSLRRGLRRWVVSIRPSRPDAPAQVPARAGVSANPISVGVVASAAQPSPSCPVCPTIAPTATATPRGHAALEAQSQPPPSATAGVNSRITGVLQWTFQGVSPIASQLAPSSDGNLYFLTVDGDLHALNAKRARALEPARGGQQYRRVARCGRLCA